MTGDEKSGIMHTSTAQVPFSKPDMKASIVGVALWGYHSRIIRELN